MSTQRQSVAGAAHAPPWLPPNVPAPPQQSADGLDDMKGPELRDILHMAGLPQTGTKLSTLINRIRKYRKSAPAPPPPPKRQRV